MNIKLSLLPVKKFHPDQMYDATVKRWIRVPDVRLTPHPSFLVKLSHVRKIVPMIKGRYVLTMDDTSTTEIPLSRTRVREFKEKTGLIAP